MTARDMVTNSKTGQALFSSATNTSLEKKLLQPILDQFVILYFLIDNPQLLHQPERRAWFLPWRNTGIRHRVPVSLCQTRIPGGRQKNP